MWHSIWVNNRWSEPEAIVKGPSVDDSVGLKSFDPYEARAVVNHGNTILVTWRTDPGLNGNGVWYSYKFLDIPNLSLQTPVTEILAENEPAPTSTNSNDIFDLSTPEVPIENPTLMVDRTSRSRVWTSGTLMAVGVIPVMLVIIVLVVIKVFRNRSS
jgi:hypothetical protein